MARIRTIKPQLLRHETLYSLEKETGLPIRIAWVGLFTVVDREGRFRWKPNELKLDVLPWDKIDFEKVLTALASVGLIQKYQVNGEFYGCIPSWHTHQKINHREAMSSLPGIEQALPVQSEGVPGQTRGEKEKEKEKEGKGPCRARPGTAGHGRSDPLLPESLDHLVEILGEKYLKDLRAIYPDGHFLNQVIADAYMWSQNNRRKATRSPDGWRRTVTTWARGEWDKYVQKLPKERVALSV